ncbi:MAG: family 20 glycosylhydrolase [Phycisphaerae bacterium]
MAITDESRLSKLLIPVKKAIFQKGFFRLPEPIESAIKKHRDKNIRNSDAYRLTINRNGIEIFSKTEAGTYYALQTLQELKTICGKNLPLCRIEDEPDFQRRGVYLDCSRGKVPKLGTLKDLVIRLAHWKINELQLYIEHVFTFRQYPEIAKGFSPFTPEEILSLQEHCKKHHIRLVGSLASFGHMEKILSHPGYSYLGEKPGFRGFRGGTTLCPINPNSIKLVEKLYSEFVPIFEAEDFNACCDETWELGKGKSRSKALVRGYGQLYLDFVLKIHRLCQKHGKRMNIWADIILKYPELLAKLPRDIVLLNWEYEQNGKNIERTKEIADSGLAFMVCPGTSGWLTHGTRLSNSIANVSGFAAQGRQYNTQGLLNTDWGDQGHRNFLGVSLHSFAHGAACAWNGKAINNDKFTENFCHHFFGQKDNQMAEFIRFLGNTYITCGKTVPNKSLLAQGFFEPIFNQADNSPIDMMPVSGLQEIIKRLVNDKSLPDKIGRTGDFERLVLEEYKLAAKMDCLSAKRAIIAKNLRAGKTVKSSDMKSLSKQMRETAKEFEKLWLERNKIARLYDNILLFNRSADELERAAKNYL